VSNFTGCLPPNKVQCEEPGCKAYAALLHLGKPLCWDHSSLESGRIREEPKEDNDVGRPLLADNR
jgi:hypothetical protein